MKGKALWSMAQITILIVGVSVSALAQKPGDIHLRGTISDYTPQTAMPGGPWEVRGQWSLRIRWDGKADFYAALTMERSDLGVMNSGGGDLNNPSDRNAHTHHIKLVNGTVTYPATGGIEVTNGALTITGNGSWPPPFEPPSSTLTIDITGGNTVTFSNIKLLLGGGAQNHFGAQAVNGVVRSVRY
jgi:hypothetical protein